jgi:O-methyltransferase involved in polyketide biosynthesis
MPHVEFFEVDLPPMLAERDRVVQLIKDGPLTRRTPIAADFIHDDLAGILQACPTLDPRIPTAFIYEGCSMYFEHAINEKIFQAMRQTMLHPDSRVWSDFVTNAVVKGETNYPEVASFLKSMEDLGESFIFGHDDPGGFVTHCGLRSLATTSVRDYRQSVGQPSSDPVLDVYRFNVSAPE